MEKEEEEALKENRYIVDGDSQNQYDVSNIMVGGEMPELKNDGERYICAKEVGIFIRKYGFCGCEGNVAKFLEHVGELHRLVCLNEWGITRLSYALDHQAFAKLHKPAIEIAKRNANG